MYATIRVSTYGRVVLLSCFWTKIRPTPRIRKLELKKNEQLEIGPE